jgi:hypothetical protein
VKAERAGDERLAASELRVVSRHVQKRADDLGARVPSLQLRDDLVGVVPRRGGPDQDQVTDTLRVAQGVLECDAAAVRVSEDGGLLQPDMGAQRICVGRELGKRKRLARRPAGASVATMS